MKRLVSADRKWVRRIKFRTNLRQLPITQREHCIINREYQKIDVSSRFTFGSDQNIAAHQFTRLRCRTREMRLDFQFAIRPAHFNVRVGEAFSRKLFVATWFDEVDRDRRIRRIFFFNRQLDSTGVSFYWNKNSVEDLSCLDRDPGYADERRLYRERGLIARQKRLGAMLDLERGLVYDWQLGWFFARHSRFIAHEWRFDFRRANGDHVPAGLARREN